MPAITGPEKSVGRYFHAWKYHDTELLRRIFAPGAQYIIRGKCTYYGIDKIVEYWERNERRQEDLELHWKVLRADERVAVAEFGAAFFNPETKTRDKVHGQIIFLYDREGRISKLSEAYRKQASPVSEVVD